MRLQAQPPFGMLQQYRTARSVLAIRSGPSIGCKKKCRNPSPQTSAASRQPGKHQLQFIARRLHKLRACLWTHAYPVDTRRCLYRAIRLHRNFKIAFVQCVDQHAIQLQQRFASRAHYESRSLRSTDGPCCSDSLCQIDGGLKSPSAFAVHAHKLCIAELADRRRAIALAPRPQIASRKPAEHRRAPGLRAFTLQRIKISLTA